MKAKILILLLAFGASSCGSVSEAYVAADKATYQAIATEYQAYVLADPKLDPIQRDRRLRTLATWRSRLAAASSASLSQPSSGSSSPHSSAGVSRD